MSVPTPKEIREQYSDDLSESKEIRDQGKKDMLCVEGKVWESEDPNGKKARDDSERPCLSLDEINQYLNQSVNQFRQNKRGIKLNPAGNGASDKTAEFRQNMIRGIEYRSKAQQAYTTAFEGAIQRSYGYMGVGRKYGNEDGFDQELYIRRIANPDTVVHDQHYKDAIASDMDHGFITDRISKSKFKRQYGSKAKQVDFTSEQEVDFLPWIGEKQIQIAEYWHFRTKPTTLYLLDDGSDEGLKVKKSDFGKGGPKIEDNSIAVSGKRFKILKEREIEQKSAWQIFTNGVEILDEVEFGGPYLGIIPVFGKEIFVDEGSGAKRKLISMVRLARSPLMLYCYYRTCEAEAIGMIPKAPMVLYEGQAEGHEEELQNLNKLPLPYVQIKAQTDATGQQILPPPGRLPYQPDLQGLELAAEAARRAIQAAMGINPLPTVAQRQNQKSGIALGKIQEEQQIGAFHFVDNMDYALQQVGTILNWHLGPTYDTVRDIGIRKPDDSHEVITLNKEYPHPKTGEVQNFDTSQGDHDVNVSTGQSYQSMRDEAAEFATTIVQNIEALPIPPIAKQKFFALIIKLKNLGPLGDAMAEIIDPEQGSPQQQVQQMQAQAAQQQQLMQEMTQELQKLKLEKAGKVIDHEYALKMQQIKNDLEALKVEVMTKAQKDSERVEAFMTFWQENHSAAHEAGMQAADHAHESDMADKNAVIASSQSAQDAAQQPTPAQ